MTVIVPDALLVTPYVCGSMPSPKFDSLSKMAFYKCMHCGDQTGEYEFMLDARKAWNANMSDIDNRS